jgi:phosphatidylinositol alpha-1,6-mannosyltransferase
LEKVKIKPPYILSVGDVRERKGYHIFIPAFAKTLEKFPDLNYIIIGFKQDNDYTKKIQAMIKRGRLEHRIHLLEDIGDDYLEELYAHAELFVLLPVNVGYDFEGFGLVFLEAAINGLPSVTTKGNGSEDAVIDGKTGLTVAQNNIDEATAAIEKILSDPNLKNSMSHKAREFAGKMSWEDVCRRYIEIYKSLW